RNKRASVLVVHDRRDIAHGRREESVVGRRDGGGSFEIAARDFREISIVARIGRKNWRSSQTLEEFLTVIELIRSRRRSRGVRKLGQKSQKHEHHHWVTTQV